MVSSANEAVEWYLRKIENELYWLKEATFHGLEEQSKKIMPSEYSWRKNPTFRASSLKTRRIMFQVFFFFFFPLIVLKAINTPGFIYLFLLHTKTKLFCVWVILASTSYCSRPVVEICYDSIKWKYWRPYPSRNILIVTLS